jgi:hypothetical protein
MSGTKLHDPLAIPTEAQEELVALSSIYSEELTMLESDHLGDIRFQYTVPLLNIPIHYCPRFQFVLPLDYPRHMCPRVEIRHAPFWSEDMKKNTLQKLYEHWIATDLSCECTSLEALNWNHPMTSFTIQASHKQCHHDVALFQWIEWTNSFANETVLPIIQKIMATDVTKKQELEKSESEKIAASGAQSVYSDLPNLGQSISPSIAKLYSHTDPLIGTFVYNIDDCSPCKVYLILTQSHLTRYILSFT